MNSCTESEQLDKDVLPVTEIKTEPQDMKYEMITKTEKFQHTVIKSEVDIECHDITSIKTKTEVGVTNKTLGIFLENKKSQFEQIKAEEDEVTIPAVQVISGIEETNIEESKCNLHMCDFTKDSVPPCTEYKNSFVEHNLSTGMCNEKSMFSHTRQKRYLCSSCGKLFSSKSRLSTHERIHTGEKPYTCELCCKSFSAKSSLNSHVRSHRSERPFICTVCSKSFTHKNILKAHMRIHTSKKPFMCNFCGKFFLRKHDLIVHNRVHTGEKPYTCNFCSKSFSIKKSLKVHIHYYHTDDKSFMCNLCNKTFSDTPNLILHICLHKGNHH